MTYDLTHPLILGFGKTGQSCLRYLSRLSQQIDIFDTREAQEMHHQLLSTYHNADAHFVGFDAIVLSAITVVVVSPGFDPMHPLLQRAKEHNISIIGDIELFMQVVEAPVIAITGTNAKSTVTTLVTQMINAAGKRAVMGGNIGTCALDLLANLPPDYYVLELSSFQLEHTASLKAKVAVVLNISPDHLDRHETLEHYQRIKEQIYQGAEVAVINRTLTYFTDFKRCHLPIFSFGLDATQDPYDFGLITQGQITYLSRGNELLLNVNEVSPGLSGMHNLENALAALALIAPLNLPLAPQLEVIKHFKGLPHRCEWVATIGEAKWFNDSKGTNVGATLAAILGLAKPTRGKIVLLLGGVGKNQDFSLLQAAIKQHVKAVIVFGQDAQKIANDLAPIACHFAKDLDEALRLAQSAAQAGDAVLFSPACASYDMFRNFEHRGEMFVAKVTALAKAASHKTE